MAEEQNRRTFTMTGGEKVTLYDKRGRERMVDPGAADYFKRVGGFTEAPKAAAPKGSSALPSLNATSPVMTPSADKSTAISDAQANISGVKSMLNQANQRYQDITNQLLNLNPDDYLTGALDTLEKAGQNISTITSTDEERIRKAGEMAGMRYDPMIAAAKEQAVQGRASNLSSAAKYGGLDTSAWVGLSSLVGEDYGAKGFEGVGGKLAQLGSEYDRQVSSLESAQQQTIMMAEQSERKAILTGKRDDWKYAQEMYDLARERFEEKQSLLMNQEDIIRGYADQIEEQMLEVRDEIKRMATSGIPLEDLSPEEITMLEEEAGYTPGTLQAQYQSYFDEYMAENEKAMFDQGIKLLNVAKTLDAGKEYQVPGTDITVRGLKQTDPKVTEMDMIVGGKVYRVGMDKGTGEELWRVDTGKTKVASGGGGKTSTTFPNSFSAWYSTTFGTAPEKGDPEADAEYDRWKAGGGATGVKARTQKTEEGQNPGGYTPQELRKLRTQGIDPKNVQNADQFLYDKDKGKYSGAANDPFAQLLQMRMQQKGQ